MANCPSGKLPLLNGECCGFGKQPDDFGLKCVDMFNLNIDTNLLKNLNTDLGTAAGNNSSNKDGKNLAWKQFLNPDAINNITGGIAGIIAAKNPAPVHITNVEAPKETAESRTNTTAIICSIVGFIDVTMLVIILMKRKKVN